MFREMLLADVLEAAAARLRSGEGWEEATTKDVLNEIEHVTGYDTSLSPSGKRRTRYNAGVRNPWSELPARSPTFSTSIGAASTSTTRIHNNDERVIVQSIPEPFIGNPQSAKVVLLSLNPGHSDDDAKAHSDAAFREAMMRNLRHEAQECPFYALNPKFAWTACGIWWKAHTSKLQMGRTLFGINFQRAARDEWFPYHSKTSALPIKPRLPIAGVFVPACQRDAGEQDRRRDALEEALDERLPAVQNIPFPQESPEPAHQSPATGCTELFERIVEALRENSAPSWRLLRRGCRRLWKVRPAERPRGK